MKSCLLTRAKGSCIFTDLLAAARELLVYLSNRILSNTDPGLCDAARLGRRAAQSKR